MNDAKPSVLNNYPKAYAVCTFVDGFKDLWLIFAPLPHRLAIIGCGDTEAGAWQDAVNFGPDTSKR